MRYRVQWEEAALNELANAWLNADPNLRGAITLAVDVMDRELAHAPFRTASRVKVEGES